MSVYTILVINTHTHILFSQFDVTSAFMARASKKQSSSHPPSKPPLTNSTSPSLPTSTETDSSDTHTKENTPPNTTYSYEHTRTTTTNKMAANRSDGDEVVCCVYQFHSHLKMTGWPMWWAGLAVAMQMDGA